MNAPLVPITIAFLAGILCGAQGWNATLPLTAGALGSAMALRRTVAPRPALLAMLLLWAALGWLRMSVWVSHPFTQLERRLSDAPKPVRLHGIVRDDPVEPFAPSDAAFRQTCVLELLHADDGAGWEPVTGRLHAMFQFPKVPVAYGDEVLIEGQWSRVPMPGNPGQYDWHAALWRQRIFGLFRLGPADGLVVLRSGQGSSVLAAVFRLRARWERLLQQTFNERDAGLLRSLLLGQRVALDQELKDAFVETGTIHLLVISGFNVGLVAGVLELFFRLLALPWRLRLLLLALALGGYCLLTGVAPPVARATLMAWVVLGALAMDRVISWPNTLAAAALLILAVHPAQLFDPGFQLSFGAVMSLMAFTGRWQSRLEPCLQWLHPGWVRRYITLSLSATGAVWVGLAPVLAWYFHLVSPVSMLANLLLAPLMSALISGGTASLLAASAAEPVIRWASGPLTWLLQATLQCVSWCHALPGGFWFVGHPSSFLLMGYYLLLGVSVLRTRLRWSPARILLCWAAALTVWLWSLVARSARESRWLRVDVLDVGHGDSIVVRTPRGQAFLVDAGTTDAGWFRVLPFLRSEGLSALDAVVVTHTDADHLGGAIPLLQEIAVGRLLTNGVQDDTMSARELRRFAASRGIPEVVLVSGMRLSGATGVAIEVLHPPPGLVPGAAPESNDNSLVLKMTKGAVSILLCGDIEEEGLPWLLDTGRPLSATVLKVPHHGSRLGTAGERFFDAVQPKIAILSVGRLHHLPAVETLQALQRTGARIYSTREDGAIHLRTDGRRLEVRTFKHPRRETNFGF
ncbi:MAG: DNA internalization-related competence protein ComEC/Rec2 [Candidatus Omnitrophica bacterium]|nr:DNA internalization-related competence protein ComEC/Rec2 [Candidatus Omnitrophota bacterium]